MLSVDSQTNLLVANKGSICIPMFRYPLAKSSRERL